MDYEEYLSQLDIKEESKRLYRPVLRRYCRNELDLTVSSKSTQRFRISVINGYLKWKKRPILTEEIPHEPKKVQEYVTFERYELILSFIKLKQDKFIAARDLLIFWLLGNRHRIEHIPYLTKSAFVKLADPLFMNYFAQRKDSCDRLIVTRLGTPITSRTIRRKIRSYGERFGIVLTSKMLRDPNLLKSNLFK